jgi:SH3 domain protein
LKTLKTILATLALTLCMNLSAATRYVSDDLFIYLHSGPSLEYRIIGTLKVGETVSSLKYDSKAKFMQVETQEGKTGWVKNSQLQEALPAKTLLPEIKEQLQAAQAKLANIAQQSDNIEQQKIQLITEKEHLVATIDDLKAKNRDLELQQDTEGDRIKMEWLLNGGSVLFFGVLLGLLLPFLPRRKKRKDNW